MKRLVAATALAVLMEALTANAQSLILNNPGKKSSVVIRNATIVVGTGAVIARGTIVFSGGTIRAVGTDVTAPEGAEIIDGSGLFVYPGLIDSGTAVGLTEISSVAGTNDVSEIGDLNPNVRVAVALNAHSNIIPVTRVNGITTVLTEPSGGLISGQDALIQLSGWTPKEMILKAPVAMHLSFPAAKSGSSSNEPQDEEVQKEAKKSYGKKLDLLRDTFRDARAYATALRAREKTKGTRRFETDVILEALVPVVEGKLPVILHAELAADIREAIKFADEQKIRMILSGAADAQLVATELAAKKIPVLLGPVHGLPPREDDPYDYLFTNALALHKAGVRFAFRSDESRQVRNLPYQAANAVAFGLPKEEALKALTIYPAEIFGVADKIGSLEAGKIANIILTDGDPLEVLTKVRRLFIGGEEIPLENHQTILYEKFKQRPRPAE